MPYLDVVRQLKGLTALPVAAYHVSGEYAMLKAAAEKVSSTKAAAAAAAAAAVATNNDKAT